MMYRIFASLSLVLSLLCSCSSSNVAQSKWPVEKVVSVAERAVPNYQKNYKALDVKGNVKSIVCTNYRQFVPNSWLTNYVTKENYTFDKQGNILEEVCYLEDEQFHYRYRYAYDKMGNCLKKVSLTELADSVVYTYDMVLNKRGLYVSGEYTYADRIDKSFHRYECISDTLVIYYTVHSSYPSGDRDKFVERYRGDNLVSSEFYSNGKLISKEEHRYDERNNEVFYSDSSVSGLQIWDFRYDTNDRETYWSVRNEKSRVHNEITFTRDNNGNVIKQVTVKNGKIDERESYVNTYTYDDRHNWVKRTRNKLNGDPISVLERKIAYY